MKNLANKHITKIMPYQPGKPIEEVKRELGLRDVIKLASNENPLGPSPAAIRAMREAAEFVNRYPDGGCFYLKRKLAGKLRLRPENLILGNGSDELLDLIIKAFLKKGEEVLTSKRTFLEYRITAQIHAARIKEVALKDFTYDLKAMAKAVTKKTKLIFIANPNNPTGTYVSRGEVEKFLRQIPKGVIVVFDEAYREYVTKRDFPDTQKYISGKNVIILRTFSKAYGLAGLRVGYAIAKPTVISALNRVRQPFNVSSMAQAAALAALGDAGHIKKVRDLNARGIKYLEAELAKIGLKTVPSAANFVLVDTGRDAKPLFRKLLKRGVIVRPMGIYGLKNFIRVTTGTREENRRFIRALQEAIG